MDSSKVNENNVCEFVKSMILLNFPFSLTYNLFTHNKSNTVIQLTFTQNKFIRLNAVG